MRRSKGILISGAVTIVIVGIASMAILYKPQPTHNPFDPVFNVSINKLLEDGYVHEYIECGYSNYYKEVANGRIFYQSFMDEPDIVGKGCEIILDTLCFECANNTTILQDTIHTEKGFLILSETQGERNWIQFADSLWHVTGMKSKGYTLYKFDTLLINERLKPFEVSIIDTSIKHGEYYYEFLVRHTLTDSIIYCYLDINRNSSRTIQMLRGNPQRFSEKPVIKFFSSLFKKEEDIEEMPIVEEVIEN